MTPPTSRRALPAVVALALGALSGCGYDGARSLPLPGAIDGDDTYAVTVVLDDATNLVAKETCRTNDTVIGSVESVELDENLKARVVCRIRDDVELPGNVLATLRETSLLGERFLALDPPPGVKPTGRLAPGAVVAAADTRVDPNVEMVLGALSLVLNGGGLTRVETISRELTVALAESDLDGTLARLDTFVSSLDARRDDLTRSLVALDRLAVRLARQRGVIAGALDAVPDGLAVLDRQRPRLVRSLRELSRLSRVAVPLIRRSKEATVADLKHLEPILTELTRNGHDIALTLERLSSFPFPSNGMGIVRGDYGGMVANVRLDIDTLNEILIAAGLPPSGPLPPTGPTGPTLPVDPDEPLLPPLGLPPLPGLDELIGLEDQPLDLGTLLRGAP